MVTLSAATTRADTSGPEWLTIEVGTDDSRALVRLTGELDMVTAPRLAAVLEVLRRGSHRTIRVELAALDFLSAAGVGVLYRADEALRASGGRLVLTGSCPLARRILTSCGLERLLAPAAPRTLP